MAFTITLGWWLIPAALTIIIAWYWGWHDYGSDLIGAVLFVAAFGLISFVWMVYFGIGWALS